MIRPGGLLIAGCVLAIAVAFLWPTPGNPPGFHRDEASAAFNAWSIAQTGHDEDGRRLPLFFVSYGGYLSPVFPYALSAVFLVVDPSIGAARSAGAVAVLLGVLLLGWLAYRRARSPGIAVVTLVLAAGMPWLYELGRTGLEITAFPPALALVLVAVDAAHRTPARRSLVSGAAVGASLAFLTYSYAGGRGLAPLLAVALAVFLRQGARWVVGAWATFALLLAPLLAHRAEVRARFDEVTAFTDGMSLGDKVTTFLSNYAHEARLWNWIVDGDPRPTHVTGVGHLFAAVVVLAAAGLVDGLRRRDRWTAWLAVALILSPVPAAITNGRDQAERLLQVPILLLALAIGGMAVVGRLAPRPRAAVAATLGAGVVLQIALYGIAYHDRGPLRTGFEAGVPALLDRAFAESVVVYSDHDDRYTRTMARWYLARSGMPAGRYEVLPDGGVPPDGAIVFGRIQACDFACTRLAESGLYWIARADVQAVAAPG
jgi:hypothetical protein